MTNHSQLFPDKKERTDFWIAISVIIIFLACIIFYLFGGKDKVENSSIASSLEQKEESKTDFAYTKKAETINVENQKTDFEEGLVDDVVIPAEPEEVEVEKGESISTLKKEVLPIEKEIVDEELSSTSKITEELPEYIDEEATEIEEKAHYEAAEEKIAEIPAIKETVKPDLPSKTESIEEVNPKNRNIKLESTSQDTQYGCIIIVGSFKEPGNSKKLIQKLKAQNYPVYEGAYKGYYIVGVNSDCATNKITPLLKKMRKDYEKTAWIYKR